jgi:hypothetical protein
MTSKSILGWTEFPDESRDMFLNRIYDRMDTIFGNWLYGEYDDCDLRCAIESDGDVNHLCYLYDLLHDEFRDDVNERYNMIGVKQWLWCRHELSNYPTREMRKYYKSFSMHGPDGEVERVPCGVWPPVESNCLVSHTMVARPVVDTPRRSTRVKYPRDFYYGY